VVPTPVEETMTSVNTTPGISSLKLAGSLTQSNANPTGAAMSTVTDPPRTHPAPGRMTDPSGAVRGRVARVQPQLPGP
jgi:hypothetical protein